MLGAYCRYGVKTLFTRIYEKVLKEAFIAIRQSSVKLLRSYGSNVTSWLVSAKVSGVVGFSSGGGFLEKCLFGGGYLFIDYFVSHYKSGEFPAMTEVFPFQTVDQF